MLDLIKTMLMKKEIEKQVGKSAYEKPVVGLVNVDLGDVLMQSDFGGNTSVGVFGNSSGGIKSSIYHKTNDGESNVWNSWPE